MDSEQIISSGVEFLKGIPARYYVIAALLLGGLICISIGLIQLKNLGNNNENRQPTSPQSTPAAVQKIDMGKITIDVEGGVFHPGVYKIPANSRVQDALIAAGGLSTDADREAISKKINLAAKVVDASKLYIPKVSDSSVTPTSYVGIQNLNENVLGDSTSAIDINSATVENLDNLPGVGPVTAQKIISGRPYNSVDELLTKKVVSNSIFQKIKDLVVAE